MTSDLRAGVDFDRLHVLLQAGGATVRDDTLPPSGGMLVLPLELPVADRPDGELVSAKLEALRSGVATPLVTRLASTNIVAGKELLYRTPIEKACAPPDPTTGAPPPPTCVAPQTCVAGACAPSYTDPSKLQPYTSSWAGGPPDACKPPDGGSPIVVVGQGQSDYLPLDDMQVVQIEAGPQGGHHVWIAVRMKNLHQSGTITSITGHLPEIGVDVGPFDVIFTFDPDEGGYCKLVGLRFQLDIDVDITTLFGHILEITVTETDRDGTVGVGTKTVKLSDNTL